MTDSRTHRTARIIMASPRAIFRAFLDPEAVASWRPLKGMTARIYRFEPRVGGYYRMAFIYTDPDHDSAKSTKDADIFEGRFVALAPHEELVEAVDFKSDNPAFCGTMIVTTRLTPVPSGTEVRFLAENVPPGISAVGHQADMDSTLKKLARFIE